MGNLTKLGDQRQKVGAGITDIVILGVVGIGGYFAYKAISGLFGNKSAIINENNQSTDAATAAANAATQAHIQATGQTTTLSPSTVQSLANSILNEVTSVDPGAFPLSGGTDLPNLVDQVNNSADWVALVNAFGTKKLLDGRSVDLVTALSMALPVDYKTNLDSFFVSQGIKDPQSGYYISIP